MSSIEYSILGPVAVRPAPDAPPIDLAEKPKLLLARLLVAEGTAISESTLANDVWGDDSDLRNPTNSVHRLVSQLRDRLGDVEEPRRVIVREGAAYRLDADPLSVDAERFKLLSRRGHALLDRHPRAARAMLEEALASWRGTPLSDCDERNWIGAAVIALETLRDSAEVDLNEALLLLGDPDRVESMLRVQIAAHPADERRRGQLIRALEQTGRGAEASLAYRAAVQALGAPGAELRRLGDRIARGVRPAPAAPASGPNPTRRHDSVLLHARLERRDRRDGEPATGTAALIVDRAGGEPHMVGGHRLVAAFDEVDDAAGAAVQLARHPSLRCAVGLHSGGFVQLADRIGGPGPSRCRTLAEAAHPGQVLVSAAARDRRWGAVELRDLGEQRYDDLLPGEPVFELREGTQTTDFPAPDTLSQRPHNLPVQQTRFVGRYHDLAALSRFVLAGELITLTGTGGCGKTRLALQLAASSIARFEEGAWFTALAELPTGAGPHSVAVAIAAQLGVRALPDEPVQEALVRHLSDRSALVVVDNCEHVVGACKEVIAAVRAGCPQACIIATSREPLRIDGERVVEVPAMATVAAGEADALPDAVELLLERAGSLPDALTTSEMLEHALRICLALDGSPLAIELVAGHVPTRGLAGVAAEVDAMLRGERDLALFGSDDPNRAPRQRTIEAAIRWSHDLLSPREQRVLHRLAVFSGSFGVAEAQAVAADDELGPGEVATVVGRLVDCSVVASEPPLAGAARVRLRQAVRAFAYGHLESGGELARIRRIHAGVYRALASDIAPTLFGTGEQAGLSRLEADHDNLRAALACLVEARSAAEALELAGAMWWLWFSQGHFDEGIEWVELVLALDDAPSRERVRALRVGSHLTWWRGHYAETDRYNHELEACARAIGDAWGLAWAPMGHGAVILFSEPERALGMFEESRRSFSALEREWEAGYALQLIAAGLWYSGRERAAGEAYEEAVRVFERLGHGSVLASVRRGAGLMAARAGQRERGRSLCREALAFSESIGDRVGGAQALNFLASISRDEGDLATAAERHADALSRARQVGDLWATCSALDGIGGVAVAFGELELAARLLARSDTLAARAGYERPPEERRRRAAEDGEIRARLGERGLERAAAQGAYMGMADTVAAALAFVRRLA